MSKIVIIRIVFILCCFVILFHKALGLIPEHHKKIKDFKIEEVSEAAGFHFKHEQTGFNFYSNIEPWLSSLSSSVAVVDIDDDGWPDIYLNTGLINGLNHLYRNNHDGTFTDVAKQYGLADINKYSNSVRSVFFDANNDGTPELLMLKGGTIEFYKKNTRGQYEQIQFPGISQQSVYANAVQVLDINKDGLLDIIIPETVGRSPGRVEPLPMNFVHSINGAPTFVFENTGNCVFKLNTTWLAEKNESFTNALGVGDLRNQLKSDLWFATDYNDDQIFYQRDDLNGFTLGSDPQRHVGAKSGMSAELAYLDSEYPSVFVTHVYKNNYLPFGNTLWRFNGDYFSDYGGDYGVNQCGWGWGAKFFDVNNSGVLSLYVANGFIAGDPQKSYWYKLAVLSSAPQGIVSSPKYWPNMKGQDVSGHEQDCLFINEGNNRFYDYSNDADLQIDQDRLLGRGVAVLDYLNNGSQALTVSNQLGRAYLYKITHLNTNNWIGFKLIGTKSNRDAVGVKMEITLQNKKMIRELYPLNGYSSQSDSRLHFGLGNADRIEKINIYWPSGKKQELQSDIKLNMYHTIKEEL